MNATQRRVHDILAAAAARGAPCPTNSEIGDACGMLATSCGGTVVQLRKLGLITIRSLHKARQVTIVSTGATTAAIDAAPHWRERRELSA